MTRLRRSAPGHRDRAAGMTELASAGMISRTLDEAIERRIECASEPIRSYLTTEAVVVEDEHSDTQLAELFLHHAIPIVPVATGGRIHSVITRHDFFRALVTRFIDKAERADDPS
jgi:CBS domain-containing protein